MIGFVAMNDVLILLMIIPAVTAIIGWFTNYLAVKMIFFPRTFRGVGPIGWQGILPRHSSRFASGVADTITEHLISPKEMAERLDPSDMEERLNQILSEELPDICKDAAEAMKPGTWDSLPEQVQAMILTQVREEVKKVTRELFLQVKGLSAELLPLRSLIEEQLSGKNTGNLVRLFQRAGEKEFKFIEIYGGVFGFLIGLVQVALWSWTQVWWLMPIVGVIVGLVTNWLAIQMIFRPLEEKRYLGVIKYQGMFPKRQSEIAVLYGQIVSEDVLSIQNLFRLITQGEAGGRVAMVVTSTVESKLDEYMKTLGQMVSIEDTPEIRARVKQAIVQRVMERAPTHQPELEEYLERRLDIANTIEERLAKLPKTTFERVLRGVFEEDELTLIFCGGFLGGLVGAVQGLILLTM